MINKIYKRIHNKYSALFKFIFFLRHLLGIFFIAIVLFLSIPHFFDFESKDKLIKNHLLNNYGLKLNKYESIKYNALPVPNLEILNAFNSFSSNSINIKTKNFKIYPRLISIYNLKNFKTKKIVLNTSNSSLEVKELQILTKYFYRLKNKILFSNSEIKILRNGKLLISLNQINFSNYGYNKNIIRGKAFNKRFKISKDNNSNLINFKLLNTGIDIDLNFNENKKEGVLTGAIKAKVLNSNLKFNFEYDNEKFNINNAYFRSKDLSLSNKSVLIHHPFFSISSSFNIEDINTKLLKDFDLDKIFKSKNLIKKINSENLITYKSKKFNRDIIDDLNMNINLAFGRLEYSSNFLISNSSFNCKGKSNLLEEYPILYFNCFISSVDKKSLLKIFSVKYKIKNEPFNLTTNGNLNFLNNKINFNKIKMNKDYEASKEELKYFKKIFEIILFDDDFINIFDLYKIKEFILEVS